jgi:hypothetical protein
VRPIAASARHNQSPLIIEEQSMSTTTPAPDARSDNLLPTGDDDSGDDGRFEIAEEVSFDQQSDSTRKVGQIADDASAEALAESIEEKAQGGI